MYIEKLVGMARDENPNPALAKLSIYWSQQTKLNNPVKNAVSLWHWRCFMWTVFILLLIWTGVTGAVRPVLFTSEQGPTVWQWILFLIGGTVFVAFATGLEMKDFKLHRDAKRFCDAITKLETALGKSLEQWSDEDDLKGKAKAYLKDLAGMVIATEKIETTEIARKPWVELSVGVQSAPRREHFESALVLLTALLDIPKSKGHYFGNEAPTST